MQNLKTKLISWNKVSNNSNLIMRKEKFRKFKDVLIYFYVD